MLAELRNRGVEDVLIVCCDGLKGLPETINGAWPLADVQQYMVHLVRNSLKYSSRKHWRQITKELKEIYTAPTEAAAEACFAEFAGQAGVEVPGDDHGMAEQLGAVHPVLEVPGPDP